MQRSVPEISQRIDINPGMIDESTQNLNSGTHGCIVKRGPVGLVPVIDIDGSCRVLLLQDVQESYGVVLHDRLKKLLVHFVDLLPVVLPQGFEHAPSLSFVLRTISPFLLHLQQLAVPSSLDFLYNKLLRMSPR